MMGQGLVLGVDDRRLVLPRRLLDVSLAALSQRTLRPLRQWRS